MKNVQNAKVSTFKSWFLCSSFMAVCLRQCSIDNMFISVMVSTQEAPHKKNPNNIYQLQINSLINLLSITSGHH